MELGISSLDVAIIWYVDYFSNGEEYPSDKQIEECITKNSFPHLKYFYDSSPIKDMLKVGNYDDIVCKQNENTTYIENLPNKLVIETRVCDKPAKNFPYLITELKKNNITLNKIIDIEFFESYKSHENYLINLDDSLEDKLKSYSDTKNKYRTISHKGLVRKIYESEFKHFEEVLLGGEASGFYDLLDENLDKIAKGEFSAFLDTEKIHIQVAICSFGNLKEIPVLAYFGYGNYYPFASHLKNKNSRFARFSQLNHGDTIDLQYYLDEIKKPKQVKTVEIKRKIDECQQGYFSHYQNNFDIYSRRTQHIAKNGDGSEYPVYVDRLMMLEPVTRTKSAALLAYNYPFYE